MKKMSESEDLKDAVLISRLEKQLGRKVTDDEIKYVLGMGKKTGLNEARAKVERLKANRKTIRVRGRIVPNDDTIDPQTGKKMKDLED